MITNFFGFNDVYFKIIFLEQFDAVILLVNNN